MSCVGAGAGMFWYVYVILLYGYCPLLLLYENLTSGTKAENKTKQNWMKWTMKLRCYIGWYCPQFDTVSENLNNILSSFFCACVFLSMLVVFKIQTKGAKSWQSSLLLLSIARQWSAKSWETNMLASSQWCSRSLAEYFIWYTTLICESFAEYSVKILAVNCNIFF